MLENIIHLPHAVRVSPRAKYIRFRILAGTGLEVVVPEGCSAFRVRKAAVASENWIARHQGEIERAAGLSPDAQHLPEHIALSAQDRSYTVRYDAHAGRPHFLHTPEQDQIVVLADPRTQADVCCRLLQDWLKDQGRKVLVPWAFSLSKKHKLPIARVHIRRQKTRWASMSTSGTLSLNCHLMFLPAELVQHVLLHELCHVRHPNHGYGFQALLSRLSPHKGRYERAMKHVHHTAVPWWARF
ncbi:MAG: YgjP-like metallopeptidase domain-containing protein [Desulfovermiculus sp.]